MAAMTPEPAVITDGPDAPVLGPADDAPPPDEFGFSFHDEAFDDAPPVDLAPVATQAMPRLERRRRAGAAADSGTLGQQFAGAVARRAAEAATAPTMPADVDSERAVISSALIDPNAIINALGRVHADDFWDRRLGLIWQAIETLTKSQKPVDPVTLATELRRTGKYDAAGGMETLVELASFVGSAHAMEHYARTVASLSTVRHVLSATHKIQAEGYQRGADPDHVVSVAQTELRAALDRAVGADAVTVASVVGGVFENVLRARDLGGEVTGIATGYRELDKLLLGVHRTDLMILAARPAMGKTSFALNIGLNIARGKIPTGERKGQAPSVLVFSLEMGREQLVQRLLSQKSRVPLGNMRAGKIQGEDEVQMREAAGQLSELKLFIDDTAGISTVDMVARSKRLAMREGLDFIIVDYLQLMRGTGGAKQSREQEISEISRTLKGLAKELNVTVMALSQLNRSLEGRTDKRPMMSDLRESGAIEQDADIILFIYRDWVYNKSSSEADAEVIIAKHRAGPTGDIKLRFDGQFTRFYNLDDHVDDRYVGVSAPRYG